VQPLGKRKRGEAEATEVVFSSSRFRCVKGRIQTRVDGKWVKLARLVPYAREVDLATGAHRLRVSFRTDAGEQVEQSICRADLANPLRVLGALLNLGLRLPLDRPKRRLTVEALEAAAPTRTIFRAASAGWVRNMPPVISARRAYVLGREVVGVEEGEARIAGPERPEADLGTGGTVATWVEHVGRPCGNFPIPTFAIAASFSAPLARLMGLEPPGGGVNLYGPSSTGKTTSIEAALSVWGAPFPSLRRSWSSLSEAGTSAIAAALNDCVVYLDETATAPADQLWKALYTLANGAQPTKATRTGGLRPGQDFCVQVFMAGEASMRTLLAAARRPMTDGQRARFLELRVPRRVGVFARLKDREARERIAKAIVAASRSNYGMVGRQYLQHLCRLDDAGRAGLLAKLDKCDGWLRKRIAHANPTASELRALRRISLAMVAGELATKLGLTGWKWKKVRRHFRRIVDLWFSDLRGARVGTKEQILRRVARRLQKRVARFEDLKRSGAVQYENADGFRFAVGGENLLLLAPRTFKARYCRPYSIETVLGTLRAESLIRFAKDGRRFQARFGKDRTRKNFIAVRRRVLRYAE
jgi:putative DNA primase/helicase